ncbi:hypothetical protein CAEBREN_06326 [Caenorhabditis brenneri]|uniref:Uncharacterized protein n=1 Tax=Caenorhabditis brenneri TaxID=135651 RepID=G0NJV2_CAEBE|nr:hypothetical protein CAEBREN_06326 [Caenorhabditis brenneri]
MFSFSKISADSGILYFKSGYKPIGVNSEKYHLKSILGLPQRWFYRTNTMLLPYIVSPVSAVYSCLIGTPSLTLRKPVKAPMLAPSTSLAPRSNENTSIEDSERQDYPICIKKILAVRSRSRFPPEIVRSMTSRSPNSDGQKQSEGTVGASNATFQMRIFQLKTLQQHSNRTVTTECSSSNSHISFRFPPKLNRNKSSFENIPICCQTTFQPGNFTIRRREKSSPSGPTAAPCPQFSPDLTCPNFPRPQLPHLSPARIFPRLPHRRLVLGKLHLSFMEFAQS